MVSQAGCGAEVRVDSGKGRQTVFLLHRRHAGGFLSGTTHSFDWKDQGSQAVIHRRRLLERRREQQATAEDLWHGLLLQERARRLSETVEGGQEARPSAHWQGTRPFQPAGGGWPGLGVLAPKRRLDSYRDRKFLAFRTSARRIRLCLYS